MINDQEVDVVCLNTLHVETFHAKEKSYLLCFRETTRDRKVFIDTIALSALKSGLYDCNDFKMYAVLAKKKSVLFE